MNQKELLKAIVSELAERGITISQADTKEMLNAIESVIDTAVLEGQIVKAFGCKFERREKTEVTSGEITKKDGTKAQWEKAPHTFPKVSYLKSKKDELTREI